MKKKLNHDFMEELKELSVEEASAITGGTEFWIWLGNAVAHIIGTASNIGAS